MAGNAHLILLTDFLYLIYLPTSQQDWGKYWVCTLFHKLVLHDMKFLIHFLESENQEPQKHRGEHLTIMLSFHFLCWLFYWHKLLDKDKFLSSHIKDCGHRATAIVLMWLEIRWEWVDSLLGRTPSCPAVPNSCWLLVFFSETSASFNHAESTTGRPAKRTSWKPYSILELTE